MTSIMERDLVIPDTREPVAVTPASAPRGAGRERLRDLLWLLPVLLGGVIVNAINLGGSPQRIDDEGTYTAQAWSIAHLGELTHYTYWYDHPPLGWIQIAAYAGLTGAWDRYDVAVIAAREGMVVATAIAAVLLWMLVRRIGFARVTASAAAAIFLISPLSVQFHRQVYLDNIATMWLLAAFLLAMSRHKQLLGFIGAALTFGVAVLTKETYLLALPLLAWLMWRGADRSTRRYTLSVSAAALGLLGLGYVAFALVKGEVMPAEGRVSLWQGLTFQLASREGSGSLFDPDSLMSATVGMWWQLDAVLITTALAVPSEINCPLAMTSTRWQRRVTMSILCSISRKVTPRALISMMRSMMTSSSVAFTPAAGSSSRMIAGSAIMTRASSSSLRWPPDSTCAGS